jgi:predicted aspartyl protease
MSEMGPFHTTVGIESPLDRGHIVERHEVLVDTGAEATWIPRSILESLGISPERTELHQMADGRILERQVGYVIVHVAGKATSDDVVFAEPTDLTILGARSLEGLNLRVDARRRQLVSAGPILAASVHGHITASAA